MADRHLPLAAWLDIPTGWFFVGAGLALATIVLVSLLRTRWRLVKPWKKCALLSLWVHVLLAYLATVVEIASGGLGYGPSKGPGYGVGPPIQVAILSSAEITPLVDVTEVIDVEPAADQDTDLAKAMALEPPDLADDVEESEPADATEATAPSLDAPDLLPEPAPAKPAEPEPAETPPADALVVDQVDDSEPEAEPVPTSKPAQPPVENETTKAAEAPTSAFAKKTSATSKSASIPDASTTNAAVAPTAPPPAPYADRFATNRDQLVAGGGGNANTERAVRAALVWLAAAQSEDGRWDAKKHGAGQERYVLGQDRGGAGAKADTGVTGLALLTFLGAGHTHRDGPHTTEVAHGLDFLRRSQRSNGNLCGDAELFAQMYCHSMAAFAVSEAYAVTHDERLAPMVRAAASYSLAVQHPTDGGWRYRPGDTGDTSQLGWQVMALKSAELGGVKIPDVTWTRVDRFLRQVERGSAGGLAAYRPEGPPTRPMTAESLYCRQLITGRADGQLSRAAVDEAFKSLLNEPPAPHPINLYYWYYATLALHRAQHASPEAADAWRRWNEALTRTLLSTQREDGSWPETCLWGGYGGRVFTTSLATMCLEVYYRYAPNDSEAPAKEAAADVARRGVWQSAPR
jgi:outer membrane biosynthesis protein TonB